MILKGMVAAVFVWVLFGDNSVTPQVMIHGWKSLEYPVMARLARVEGQVVVSATLRKGENWEFRVGNLEVRSGHPMLRDAATENLKQQWFYCRDCKSLEGAKYEVTYEFRLDKECLEAQQCFKRSSVFRSGHILVEADTPMVNTVVFQ